MISTLLPYNHRWTPDNPEFGVITSIQQLRAHSTLYYAGNKSADRGFTAIRQRLDSVLIGPGSEWAVRDKQVCHDGDTMAGTWGRHRNIYLLCMEIITFVDQYWLKTCNQRRCSFDGEINLSLLSIYWNIKNYVELGRKTTGISSKK